MSVFSAMETYQAAFQSIQNLGLQHEALRTAESAVVVKNITTIVNLHREV